MASEQKKKKKKRFNGIGYNNEWNGGFINVPTTRNTGV